MRAALLHSASRTLHIAEREPPRAGAGEVLLRIRYCGICSSDLQWVDGGTLPEGTVLGHELSGEVVALGSGVSHLQPGDRVTAMPFAGCGTCSACREGLYLFCPQKRSLWGGFGQFAVAAAASCVLLPSGLSWQAAALVEPLACGARAVGLSEIRSDQSAIVIGAGMIGLACVYWLRRSGVRAITVAARSERQRDLAEALGASAFIALGDTAGALPAGIPAPPIVFECSGAPTLLARAMEWVQRRGTVMVPGMCAGTDTITPGMGLIKELRIQFAAAYSRADFEATVAALAEDADSVQRMIGAVIGLDELPAVFAGLRSGQSPLRRHCKILVDPQRA